MASVVFFRAVNVGSHQRFQPGTLAKEMADLEAVNIGAAGTFVVRNNVSASKIQTEILRRLNFEPELMICPADEILTLADGKALGERPAGKDLVAFLSVLQKTAASPARLPMDFPASGKWEVRLVAVVGRFVLSWRRAGADLYTNAVVEKHFGVAATTRNWNTLTAIHKILAK